MSLRLVVLMFLLVFLYACSAGENSEEDPSTQAKQVLPYLGFKETQKNEQGGTDTLYHTVPPFAFTNQDSIVITDKDLKGRIYVADFFFTHCPTICPVMTRQMKRLVENTSDIDELVFLSHTIDPKRDTLERLRAYREIMDISADNWHFLRGTMEYTYDIGKHGYLINADEDEEADGGYLHSEHFVLVDREGHIRGMYEGTDPERVDQLEKDIRKLIQMQYGE